MIKMKQTTVKQAGGTNLGKGRSRFYPNTAKSLGMETGKGNTQTPLPEVQ